MAKRKVFRPWVYLAILHKQRMICACGCGVRLERGNIQFDHIRELWDEGADDPSNLRAIRNDPCHKAKTAANAKQRAKMKRIRESDGLMKKKPSKRDRYLAKRDRWKGMP